MRVLAIDPGLYSTAVFYSPGSSFQSGLRWIIADIPLMQEYRRPDPRILRDLIMRFVPDRAFVELVGPMPRQGLASTSTFMRSTGYIEATVLCTGTPMSLITPQRWKKYHRIKPGSSKEDSRLLALKLVPELAPQLARKKDHGRAESVLLALYAEHCLQPIQP